MWLDGGAYCAVFLVLGKLRIFPFEVRVFAQLLHKPFSSLDVFVVGFLCILRFLRSNPLRDPRVFLRNPQNLSFPLPRVHRPSLLLFSHF